MIFLPRQEGGLGSPASAEDDVGVAGNLSPAIIGQKGNEHKYLNVAAVV
jgi:hypothetical protein